MSKNKPLEWLGQEPVEAKDGLFKVSNSGLNAAKDAAGLTKDVRKAITDFEDSSDGSAIAFCGDQVMKTGNQCTLEVGTGNSKIVYTMGAKGEARNPKTGEVSDTYARFGKRKRGVVSKTLRDGDLAAMQAKIEKALS
jgi:hypothetical protein